MPGSQGRVLTHRTIRCVGKLKMIVLFVLHAEALLPKHCTKDRDILIEQSFIRIYVSDKKWLCHIKNYDKKLKI